MTIITRFFITKSRRALAAFGLALVALPSAALADGGKCPLGNLTMRGTYVSSGTGTVIGVGPIASLALVVYNGDGTGNAGVNTLSVNGATQILPAAAASFTVKEDCTGSKIIGTTHFNLVITPDGNTINWIVTDPGVTFTGTAVRLQR